MRASMSGISRCNFARCLLPLLMLWGAAVAQEPAPSTALSDSEAQPLDALVLEIETDKSSIRRLQTALESSAGLMRRVAQARLDQTWTTLFRSVIGLADLVVRHRDAGRDVNAYIGTLRQDLVSLPDVAFIAMERLGDKIDYNIQDLSVVERVKVDQELLGAIAELDEIYDVLLQHLRVAPEFDIDVTVAREKLMEGLADAAANRSIFLHISGQEVSRLRASSAVLPENADLKGELSAAEARVRLIAESMRRIVALMAALDMDVKSYRKQILTTTGAITTDVLDVGVAANLASEWGATLMGAVVEKGPLLLLRILVIAFVLFVFYKLGKLARKLMHRALDSARVQISHLLRTMIVSSIGNLVMFLGILIALSQLGISLGPLLAGLGIAGFIIGFAMQDSLANFASGMLILLYRPFDVGDVVEVGGVHGKVSSMSLVNTTVMTLDNQTLVIPNNLIWGSVIKNVTAQRTRRVDLIFGISYSDDIEKAEEVFRDIIAKHEKTLDYPEPQVAVHELGDSSVNFIVRPWVNTADYWEVYWDLTREVKLRLDAEGISIPFPQRDVHLYQEKPA